MKAYCMSSSNSDKHWRTVSQEWKHFGSPLRPCDEDIRHMEQIVAEKFADRNGIVAQLCGVTPEIAGMEWPTDTYVVAIEQSQEMIRDIWPGDLEYKRVAIHGNWLNASLNINNNDIVIGDGCFISVAYPDGYRDLAKTLSSSLKENGIFIMRFFTQIDEQESSDHVFSELLAGKIHSFHAFKWRLAMSLQSSSQEGIRLHDIYSAWQRAEIDQERLLAQTGWSREAVATIALYENKQNYFAFATLNEIHEIFADYFHKESIYFPQYELGERCPIITFRPRQLY
jgi:hypothetical protein